MPEIARALLLPPPSPTPQRPATRALETETESAVQARREPQAAPQSFLTLIEARREDTIEIKGKQFRFKPYSGRSANSDGNVRETDRTADAGDTTAVSNETSDGEISVEILDGFGSGARERNSSAFIASFIAQERLSQGLHNPQHEAASDAYRRAGGSPSAIDNEPRVFSLAI